MLGLNKVMMVFEPFSILGHGRFLQRLLIHYIDKYVCKYLGIPCVFTSMRLTTTPLILYSCLDPRFFYSA